MGAKIGKGTAARSNRSDALRRLWGSFQGHFAWKRGGSQEAPCYQSGRRDAGKLSQGGGDSEVKPL